MREGNKLGFTSQPFVIEDKELLPWEKHVRDTGCVAAKCVHGIPVWCGYNCEDCDLKIK